MLMGISNKFTSRKTEETCTPQLVISAMTGNGIAAVINW